MQEPLVPARACSPRCWIIGPMIAPRATPKSDGSKRRNLREGIANKGAFARCWVGEHRLGSFIPQRLSG